MAFEWLNVLQPLFAVPADEKSRPPRQITKFGIGFCPGCRRLRGAASVRCHSCGSMAPVTEDA